MRKISRRDRGELVEGEGVRLVVVDGVRAALDRRRDLQAEGSGPALILGCV